MKTIDVTMVRVYLTEAKAHLPGLMKTLHDEEQVRGVTVFRGISGFGRTVVYGASRVPRPPARTTARVPPLSLKSRTPAE